MSENFNLFNWNTFDNLPKDKFVYIRWIEETCDDLIKMIDVKMELIYPITLFLNSNSPISRKNIHQYIINNRETYRKKISELLDSDIKGLIVTFDWYFIFRDIVDVANKKGIVTVLIPHEGVFSSQSRYYTDREFGDNIPICKYCLLWGELQKRTFLKRGHLGDGLLTVGSPKIENIRLNSVKYPQKNEFVLLVLQNMDCQSFYLNAVECQNSLISFMCQYAEQKGMKLVIRNPPNNVNMIPSLIFENYGRDSNYITFTNEQPAQEAIMDASIIISINSTMLLEAKLSGKLSISVAFEGLETMWKSYDVDTVSSINELENRLNNNGTYSPNHSVSDSLISDFGLNFPTPTRNIRDFLNGVLNDNYRYHDN